MIETTSTLISRDRATLTNEWVSAQARGNFHAGIGLSIKVAIPVVAIVCLLQSTYLPWSWSGVFLSILLSVAIGVYYFGHLQHVRFSIDEWIESGQRNDMINELARLEGIEQQLESLKERNRELRRENDELRKIANSKPQMVRQPVQEVKQEEQKMIDLPRNMVAARVIVREWFNDASTDHQGVSRTRLMQMGNLTRKEVEEGWWLLQSLDVAGKAGENDNAKWILVLEDEHEINDRLNQHMQKSMDYHIANV